MNSAKQFIFLAKNLILTLLKIRYINYMTDPYMTDKAVNKIKKWKILRQFFCIRIYASMGNILVGTKKGLKKGSYRTHETFCNLLSVFNTLKNAHKHFKYVMFNLIVQLISIFFYYFSILRCRFYLSDIYLVDVRLVETL